MIDYNIDPVTGNLNASKGFDNRETLENVEEAYTIVEKSKLSGIAANANNYTHPSNHNPSIITQDENNRFVTEAQISTWNAKSDFSGAYGDLTGIPSTFTPSAHSHTVSDITDFAHTHDDRYYTETEVNSLLAGYSTTSHTHAQLYYSGNLRLNTRSDGVYVTGWTRSGGQTGMYNESFGGYWYQEDASFWRCQSNFGTKYCNGSGTLKGYVFHSTNFGLLNSEGQWAVECSPTWTQLYYDGSSKLNTTSSGVDITGNLTCNRLSTYDWIYFNGAYGLFNNTYMGYFFQNSSNYWEMRSTNGMKVCDGGANIKGYMYFDSEGFGLLHSTGYYMIIGNYSNGRTYLRHNNNVDCLHTANEGSVWIFNNCSAASFTDRTPYPKDLQTAYAAVMSMQRLPEGEYDSNNKETQLDHSKLHPYIQSISNGEDGKTYRDMSATISCQNEVIKDLINRIEQLEKELAA